MTRISACDGRYVSLAQQRRAWEELNRIFGGQTPTPPPPGPTPPGPDPPDPPVVSDWSVFFTDAVADVSEILQDPEVQARLVTVDYQTETMPEPLQIPVFGLSGMGPGEHVVLVTELDGAVPFEGGLVVCGLFRNGAEFIPSYAGTFPPEQGGSSKIVVEMFSCDAMGIVTYLSNVSPEGEISAQLWSHTYSYDWADGDIPGVCFLGMTAKALNAPMGSYRGTMSFAVLKESV